MRQEHAYAPFEKKILLTLLVITIIPLAAFSFAASAFGYTSRANSPPITIAEVQQKASIKAVFVNDQDVPRVVFSGEGFAAFEAVGLSIHWISAGSRFSIEIARWLVFTDGKGRFATEWQIPAEGLSDERLQVFAYGKESGSAAGALIPTTEVSAGANLDQCANGGIGDPPVQCTLSAWVNGNLNENQAHYVEGQVVPFRMVFTGLSMGTHTVEIGYDTTENGKHAYDFLATYNYTETNALPCDAGPPCLAPPTTYAIPDDPNIPLGNPMNPPEFPAADRQFTMWGGTITDVGTPTIVSGDYTGSSRTTITVTFTATSANPVLGWGGHLARRIDWGNDLSAAAIEGSPFHMRLIALDGSGGNQDRSIQSSAVIFPARITIYKEAAPPSPYLFGFTATGLPETSFTLADTSATTNAVRDFPDIQDFSLTRRITETSPGPYTLRTIMCLVVDVSGITGSSATITPPYVDIVSKEASTVTCTFYNDFATAALVAVSGRVFDPLGRGLPGAYVSLTDTSGATRITRTNNFGGFTFPEVEAGETYYTEVIHKAYVFAPMVVSVAEEMKGLYFYPVR